ncbi:uncharacterized protein LOC129226518 [Uloborus diversus]|uniref:uncharacterized protein LOC129226518 n=1 Tax=Uloborus diversus TaxID=327109 RepID=UPI002409C71A|nr:uncharacterized protein LOC129226518 [Uloborus diversus]
MAWLQSSFTSHQLHDNSGSNLRKGYKVGLINKNTDPDKSDTPLLHDSPQSPDWQSEPSAAQNQACALKKKENVKNVTQPNPSKHSFFSSGLFDRSGSSTKQKNQNQSNVQNSSQSCGGKKVIENKKLLKEESGVEKSAPIDDDYDSDDSWNVSHSGGYRFLP